MLKIIILLVCIFLNIQAFSISSNDNYKVYNTKNYSIIYTKDNKKQAEFLSNNLDKYLALNNNLFSYKFDEPLTISLVSNNMQIANAFSTQSPSNMAVFYNGGSAINNYFANISWLKSLMLHELAHNYQINAKKSKISKVLHSTLGNNFAPLWAGIPFFTIPNVYLPTFLLEGNAVLNETLYDNGGRLYNGNHNAMKNSLVLSNKVNPTTLINDSLDFPYTTAKYIVGGFYMQYMAQRFGINKVNSFFYNHSIHSINPFLLNRTYYNHFAIGFEQSINDFVAYTKERYKNYNELKNNEITNSKSSIYFSNINNKIYFITSDLKTKKELNIYNIKSNTITKYQTTLDNGKIFKINNTLYTNSSNIINSKNYKHGLFDNSQNILKHTQGKSIQDINDNDIAYIDIKSSFNDTKLFINDKFYSSTVSNALFDKNSNIYYFKQNNQIRTLYKNKKALFSFNGYFSKLVSIKNNEIYFIANSKNGSNLYKYSNNNIYRLSPYDNIVEASIINKNNAFVSVITANNYQVHNIALNPKKSDIAVYKNVKLQENFTFNKITNTNLNNYSNSYNSLKQLQYVSSYPSITSSEDETIYTLNTNFQDPLMFNSVNIFLYKDNDDKYASLSYINTRYAINYALNYYKIQRNYFTLNSRDYGANFELFSNIYTKANQNLSLNLKQSFDDENKDKNPITLSLNHNFSRHLSLADDYSIFSNAKLIYKQDRDDNIYGLKYNFIKHIFNEFYISSDFIYLNSNDDLVLKNQRGIEVVTNPIDTLYNDTSVLMQGYDNDFYVKDMQKISLAISKPFYISKYFSKFPFSLRKEKISLKYHQYKLHTYKEFIVKEKEINLGLDILFAHKFSLPLQFKYITNDHSKDDYKFLFSIGTSY